MNITLLNNSKSVSWDEPIDMLYACHGKIKRFCHELTLLPNYLSQYGYTAAVHDSITRILTYFNTAAVLHHQDEEQQFFPTLLEYAPQARQTIEQLEHQHQQLHSAWEKLSVQLNQLIQCQQPPSAQVINDFIQSYRQHILLEEPLFELGKQHIPTTVLQKIGTIMAQRRLSTTTH